MGRTLALRALLFLAPFAAWFVWAWWARRTGRQMGATLGHLAKGLPIYDLTFGRDGKTKVEAVGVV